MYSYEIYKNWLEQDNNREKRREYYRNWYAKNGRSRAIDYVGAANDWRKNNPEKKNTHQQVHYAIKIGKVKKPKYCSSCKRKVKLVGHHEDYTKPLDVRWLY